MTENNPKRSSPGTDSGLGSDAGIRILSYLLSGILLYGGIGWLGDWVLHTSWMLPTGLILGICGSIYLVIKRYGSNA